MEHDEQLTIAFWWKRYLNLVQLKESDMPPTQLIETRRAFYGGFGMSLRVMRDIIGAMEDEQKAVQALENLDKEVLTFMINQSNG